jgi:hypothetical protein
LTNEVYKSRDFYLVLFPTIDVIRNVTEGPRPRNVTEGPRHPSGFISFAKALRSELTLVQATNIINTLSQHLKMLLDFTCPDELLICLEETTGGRYIRVISESGKIGWIENATVYGLNQNEKS